MFLPSNICYDFSMRFEADGMTFEEPSDNLFSFNSPVGACPECQGFGKVMGLLAWRKDEDVEGGILSQGCLEREL